MNKQPKTIIYNPEFQAGRDKLRWIENASRGLRVLGSVHEMRERVGRWPHTGWHCDPLGDGDTVHGVIIQLPGRSGFARFVPAVSDPCNTDCYLVDFRDQYDAPGDDTDEAVLECAHAADRLAELYAEREREYQTEEGAKLRIEEARERIASERDEAHALAREMRDAAYILPDSWRGSVICVELRRAMAAHRAAVRAAVADIRRLTDNPYSWLEG